MAYLLYMYISFRTNTVWYEFQMFRICFSEIKMTTQNPKCEKSAIKNALFLFYLSNGH